MKNLCRSKRGSCKCLQKSIWGEGGSKSPKTCLRSLWMAPKKIVCKNFVCFHDFFGISFFHLLEDIEINFLELWDDDFPELELEVLLLPSSS